VPRRQALHRFARAQDRADDVDGEDPRDSDGLHLLQPHLSIDDAGVVHECAKRAELAIARVEQIRHLRFVRHIGGGANPAAGSGNEQHPSHESVPSVVGP
jgi:hypothetical protein